ncbi:MAG: BRCT domain-containing protein [Spirochaetes bacterium]|nr:MAG: BRCT domain-containing protein [Spirochaetota bacterium]
MQNASYDEKMKHKPEEFIGKMVMTMCPVTARQKDHSNTIFVESLEEGSVGLCVGYARNVIDFLQGENILKIDMNNVVGFANPEVLSGYSFCLTGEIVRWKRPLLIKAIEFLGGSVVKSARKATHILQGDIESSLKLTHAQINDIPVLTKEEFLRLTEDALLIGRDIPWFRP